MPTRPVEAPAFTVTGSGRNIGWEIRDTGIRYVSNTSANAAVRDAAYPAPTIFFGARLNGVRWEVDALDSQGIEFD